jgi:hypothetical protein
VVSEIAAQTCGPESCECRRTRRSGDCVGHGRSSPSGDGRSHRCTRLALAIFAELEKGGHASANLKDEAWIVPPPWPTWAPRPGSAAVLQIRCHGCVASTVSETNLTISVFDLLYTIHFSPDNN